jgi:hypothetical protein
MTPTVITVKRQTTIFQLVFRSHQRIPKSA